MLNALNIKTREIIATDKDRRALFAKAEALVGREGFCIRPAEDHKAETFTSVDSGFHPTRLLDGRIINP